MLACVEHKALPFLDSPVPCWRFPPNLFPIRAGRRGEGVEHLAEWEGSRCLLQESRQPMWRPAAAAAGLEPACVPMCGCACAFVMNHPAIVCSPPCRPMQPFTWAAACLPACLLAGLLPGREEEEEEEGLLVVMKARPGRAALFRQQHPAFPLSLHSFGRGCRQEHLKVPFCAALGSPGSILRHRPARQPAPSRPPGTPGGEAAASTVYLGTCLPRYALPRARGGDGVCGLETNLCPC